MSDQRNTQLFWLQLTEELYSVHDRSAISTQRLLADMAWEDVPPERRTPYVELYYALRRGQDVPSGPLGRLKREVTFNCHPALEVLQLVAERSTATAALLLADSTSVESVVERMFAGLSGCSGACPSRAFLSGHLPGLLAFEDEDTFYEGTLDRRSLFCASWALCWSLAHEPAALAVPEYQTFLVRSISAHPEFRVLREASRWAVSRTMSSAELEVFYGLLLDGVESREAYRLACAVLA